LHFSQQLSFNEKQRQKRQVFFWLYLQQDGLPNFSASLERLEFSNQPHLLLLLQYILLDLLFTPFHYPKILEKKCNPLPIKIIKTNCSKNT